ncbi:glutamate-gated chloride channel-like [Periplaneta americana]|uniref:glutamate-gated chloride channel-like n=1 Tax=Periplaneta americana TaxID=6978 RepID=UPI0037E8440F
MDLIIQRTWTERRVEITERLEEGEWHAIAESDASRFWTPDFYVVGLRSMKFHRGVSDLKHFMLRSDKTVSQIVEAELIVKCKFDFSLYPLDVQECKMDFMSPMEELQDLYLKWDSTHNEPSVKFLTEERNKLSLSKFDLDLFICDHNFTSKMQWGAVSTLRFWVILKRALKSHFLETYVPTTMFVVMSWGSFLVKSDIVPGRMVLLVTNLLSLVTLFEATRNSSPPAIGVKCIDIWFLICISFVFFALLEYAIVLYQMHAKCPANNRISDLKLFKAIFPKEDNRPPTMKLYRRGKRRKIMCCLSYVYAKFSRCIFCRTSHPSWNILDQVAMVAFPMLFIICSCCYWEIFITKSNNISLKQKCVLK